MATPFSPRSSTPSGKEKNSTSLTARVPTISWEQLVQRTAEEQLTAWVNRTLAEAGIDGSAAIAVEDADGNRLTAVMTVDADDAEQARQLLQAQLGDDAAIEFQEAMG